MNPSEGLIRIATVVRWLGTFAGLFALLAGLFFNSIGVVKTAFEAFLYAVLFAGGGWVLAWIIEGFAEPKA